jgi:hypothetical protein
MQRFKSMVGADRAVTAPMMTTAINAAIRPRRARTAPRQPLGVAKADALRIESGQMFCSLALYPVFEGLLLKTVMACNVVAVVCHCTQDPAPQNCTLAGGSRSRVLSCKAEEFLELAILSSSIQQHGGS